MGVAGQDDHVTKPLHEDGARNPFFQSVILSEQNDRVFIKIYHVSRNEYAKEKYRLITAHSTINDQKDSSLA